MTDLDRILVGDARDTLPGVRAGSVHTAVTSIPYWGQRVYEAVEPMVWGAASGCEHEWGAVQPRAGNENRQGIGSAARNKITADQPCRIGARAVNSGTGGQWCQRCGAWRGCWGLEPTLGQYVANCIEFFRHVRRVLREDGCLFLNLGDSYASTGRSARHESPGVGATQAMEKAPKAVQWQAGGGSNFAWTLPGGLKPGDLCGVPWSVAFALRDDGWHLRSAICWAKGLSYCDGESPGADMYGEPLPDEGGYSGSVMPESVSGWRWERCRVKTKTSLTTRIAKGTQCPNNTPHGPGVGSGSGVPAEWAPCPGCSKCRATGGYVLRKGRWRPTSAHEFIFLLTVGERYYVDADAVREGAGGLEASRRRAEYGRYDAGTGAAKRDTIGKGDGKPDFLQRRGNDYGNGTRNVRNVWWLPLTDDPQAMLGWSDLWVFGPEPLSAAHYAAFPRELPRQAMRASCPRYCCPECGAPWARVIDTGRPDAEHRRRCGADARGGYAGGGKAPPEVGQAPGDVKRNVLAGMNERRTLGWLPTCPHYADALDAAWAIERDTLPRVRSARKRWQQDKADRWEFRAKGRYLPPLALRVLDHEPGTILDPCLGSGTTALVAVEEGRHWLGCEPSAHYAATIATPRIQEADPAAGLPVVGNVPVGTPLFPRGEEQ